MFNAPYTAAYINGQIYNPWEIKAAPYDDNEHLLRDPTYYDEEQGPADYEELDPADYEDDDIYPDEPYET